MRTERAVMLVNKLTYFGEFGYLNCSCIRKKYHLTFLSSSRDKFMLLSQNSVMDVSFGFWLPAWHLHTKVISINLGKKVTPLIFHKKHCCDLNLSESLCTFTFCLFIDSRLNLDYWLVFIFILIYFEWHDTENQQYMHYLLYYMLQCN